MVVCTVYRRPGSRARPWSITATPNIPDQALLDMLDENAVVLNIVEMVVLLSPVCSRDLTIVEMLRL